MGRKGDILFFATFRGLSLDFSEVSRPRRVVTRRIHILEPKGVPLFTFSHLRSVWVRIPDALRPVKELVNIKVSSKE